VLKAGAMAALAGALRPAAPALAARPGSLFEQDLDFAGRAVAARAGWRTTEVLRAPRRFDLIGLRWARGSHAEAQVRARRRGGEWTRWVALHPTGDHGPDAGPVVPGTDPAFTGAADEYQLRLRGTPRALRARFVRALPTATVARRLGRRLRRRGRAAKVRQAGSPPVMVTRSEWGADSVPPREPPLYGQVQLAFVHHTVTANDYAPEDSAGIVLGIARFHRNGNGWNDIGYNFLVDKYGQIFEGRAGGIDQAVVGAQAQGWNSTSTGVACLGTFTSVAQTPEGMDALARLIGWKLTVHAVPTQGPITVTSAGGETNRYPAGTPVTFQRISGHRDGNNTSCPGDILYTQLDALRTAAAGYASPTTGLSVYAAPEVRGLKPVDVAGSLRFADGSLAGGATVLLDYRPAGGAWTSMGSAICAGDGTWRTKVTFPRTGHMRATFGGDSARGALVSPQRKITVLARLNLALGRSRLRLGGTVKAGGTATPAATVALTLERRYRRRWVRERTRVLKVRGDKYTVRLRPRARGKYRVTVQVGPVKRHRQLKVH
jgi:N-acetylmuramoyl-L-alanine amidase-like protein